MDMARIGPSKDTRPERRVRMLLVRLGLRHRRNFRGLAGCPDFFLEDLGVALFVDGRFWHSPDSKARRISAFWDDKIRRNVARDRRANRALRMGGLRVVRIWDSSMRGEWERRLERALAPTPTQYVRI